MRVFGVEDERPAAEAGLQRGQQSHYVAFTIAKGLSQLGGGLRPPLGKI